MKYKNFSLNLYLSFRSWRDRILHSPARWLVSKKITPNQISLTRLLLMLPVAFAIGDWPWVSILLIIVNFILDAFDGAVARIAKSSSLRGRALDVIIDNFYVVPMVMALIWFNFVSPFWTALYLINLVINYFLSYIRFGIEIGHFPFSFSKYFIYVGLLVFALNLGNYYDYALVFWGVFLFVENCFSVFSIYKNE